MSGFSIDSAGTAAGFQASQLSGAARRGIGGLDDDGDDDASGSVERGRDGGGRAFLQSVFQALSQLGLTASSQGVGSATSAGQASANASGDGAKPAGSASGDRQGVRHALHAFMHSLFHALRASEPAQGSAGNGIAQGNGNASASQPNYGDLVSALQALLQNVGSSASALAIDGSGSDLQTAFQNMVQALGATDSSASSTPPTLQRFLQTLLQDLSNRGGSANGASLSPAGTVVATTA
jgi:hypothetical protein